MRLTGWTADELRDRIRLLEDMISRGIRSVEYNGERIEYSTIANLRDALADLEIALDRAIADPEAPVKRRGGVFYFSATKGV